ncbi:MAG: transketolase, partial [Hyphomonas sp.]|nr:transketolase [Hyphomonas sp.]
ELVDHYTYVIAGDGCLMEGISHEAIDMAGHMKLGRLIVFWDDNSITIDGATDVSTSTRQTARFEASGWHVQSVDGHDREAVARAIEAARADVRPSLIACKTVIGYGAPTKQGTSSTHGEPLGDDEIAATRKALGWAYPPFEIPDDIRSAWRAIATRGAKSRTAWEMRLAESEHGAALTSALAEPDAGTLKAAIAAHKRKLSADAPKVATRKASQMALEVINETLPNTVGGSADLTGSNNTKTSGMAAVTPNDYSGRYIHYGVREHGM